MLPSFHYIMLKSRKSKLKLKKSSFYDMSIFQDFTFKNIFVVRLIFSLYPPSWSLWMASLNLSKTPWWRWWSQSSDSSIHRRKSRPLKRFNLFRPVSELIVLFHIISQPFRFYNCNTIRYTNLIKYQFNFDGIFHRFLKF